MNVGSGTAQTDAGIIFQGVSVFAFGTSSLCTASGAGETVGLVTISCEEGTKISLSVREDASFTSISLERGFTVGS